MLTKRRPLARSLAEALLLLEYSIVLKAEHAHGRGLTICFRIGLLVAPRKDRVRERQSILGNRPLAPFAVHLNNFRIPKL